MPNKNNLATILLINGCPDLKASVDAKKSELACDIVYCETAGEAQALLQARKVQLVLSNIHCGDMSAVALLKSLPCRSYDFPVVVFTTNPSVDEVIPLIRIGVRDCIVDPLNNMNAVRESIEWAIASHSSTVDSLRLEDTNRELQRDLSQLQIDLQAGRYVQRKMLPETPMRFGAYEFSHYLLPSSYLSGDFVDYTLIGERYVTFLIADVSGHGASSAFITVLLKNIIARLRSTWSREGDDTILTPNKILQKVNQELIALESGKHATMFVAVLDMQTHSLCYSMAGHHPLPVLSTPQGTEFVTAKGRPVGLFPQYEFQQYQLALPKQFSLVLFSDGVLEIFPQYSLQQKEQALLAACEHSAVRDVQSLSQRLGIKPVQNLPDDIAIFLLKCST